LAPTSQPEIRRLRRWICEQVRSQADGREPVPWLGISADEAVANARPVDWDPTAVLAASVATIAADDANRILAANPAVSALLGWSQDELVGRRIVSVIPHRFREAHIAAFTMHLLTERTTILNRTVEVPALHRDGTEVMVRLLVRRENAGGGRAVFVATMRPADDSSD
jgi:PAS domain S-box-containing protein